MAEEKNQSEVPHRKEGRFEKEWMPEERREPERPHERPRKFPTPEVPEEAPVAPPPAFQISEEAKVESKKLEHLPEERQIQALVDLAFHKGLRYSIDTARALGNPHILDKFHDLLIDHLYKELVERGKLKEL